MTAGRIFSQEVSAVIQKTEDEAALSAEVQKEANDATTAAFQALIDQGTVISVVPDQSGYGDQHEITRICAPVVIDGELSVLEGRLVHKEKSGKLEHGVMTVSKLISKDAITTKSQLFSFTSRVDDVRRATGTIFYTEGFRVEVLEPEKIKEYTGKVNAVTAALKNPHYFL